MDVLTKDQTKQVQREWETTLIADALMELYKLTNVSARRNPLSLTDFLKKHSAQNHSKAILELSIVTRSISDAGSARPGQKSYIWTSQHRMLNREAAEHLAAIVFNKTEDIRRIEKLNKQEDQKFKDKVNKGNLKKLDHVSLRAIGTVHTFMKDVHALTKTGATVHQLTHITGPIDAVDHKHKLDILDRLKQLCIRQENDKFVWFESEPDVDFAKMVVADIVSSNGMPVAEAPDRRGQKNPRTDKVKELIMDLLKSVQEKPSEKDPAKVLKNSNLKSVIRKRSIFHRIDNKWFLITDLDLPILAEEIYADLQRYQEKYLNNTKNKKVIKEVPKVEKVEKEERQPRKRGNDVGDLFVLRADAITAIKAYKNKLKSLGMEDHKFMEEIKKF